MAHRRRRANGFVRALGIFFLFKRIRRLRQIMRPVVRADIFTHFSERLRGNPGRIGSHIGDQTDLALFTEFHAFI